VDKVRIRFVSASSSASQLGVLLRTAREKAGLSLQEVVSNLPLAAEDLQRLENGELIELPSVVLIALAENLGIDASELLSAAETDQANRRG